MMERIKANRKALVILTVFYALILCALLGWRIKANIDNRPMSVEEELKIYLETKNEQ